VYAHDKAGNPKKAPGRLVVSPARTGNS